MTTKLIKITDTTLRDAHQSLFATRFNNSTISKLAPVLDKVGYDVLEVWGGATFDSCIRYLNEDPWDRLKMIKRLLFILLFLFIGCDTDSNPVTTENNGSSAI